MTGHGAAGSTLVPAAAASAASAPAACASNTAAAASASVMASIEARLGGLAPPPYPFTRPRAGTPPLESLPDDGPAAETSRQPQAVTVPLFAAAPAPSAPSSADTATSAAASFSADPNRFSRIRRKREFTDAPPQPLRQSASHLRSAPADAAQLQAPLHVATPAQVVHSSGAEAWPDSPASPDKSAAVNGAPSAATNGEGAQDEEEMPPTPPLPLETTAGGEAGGADGADRAPPTPPLPLAMLDAEGAG